MPAPFKHEGVMLGLQCIILITHTSVTSQDAYDIRNNSLTGSPNTSIFLHEKRCLSTFQHTRKTLIQLSASLPTFL